MQINCIKSIGLYICLRNSSQCENTLSAIKSRMFVVRSSMRYSVCLTFQIPKAFCIYICATTYSVIVVQSLIYIGLVANTFAVALLAAHKIKKNITTVHRKVNFRPQCNVMYMQVSQYQTNQSLNFKALTLFSFCIICMYVYCVCIVQYVFCMLPQTFLHKSTLVLFNIQIQVKRRYQTY